MEDFDLIVIGAGPGGYAAAIKAAQFSKKVLLIEKDEVGGTCLNRGCIPTKALLHTSSLFRQIQGCDTMGIHVEKAVFDFEKLQQRKNQVVGQLRAGVEGLLKGNRVTVMKGNGVLEGPSNVTLTHPDGTREVCKAPFILLAPGSVPAVPPIKGSDLAGVVTSDALLMGDGAFYNRLIIIGGGVIGVEFATIYRDLGCAVTILEAADRILPGLDREISQNLTMILKKRGIAVYAGAKVEEIAKAIEGLRVSYILRERQGAAEADGVLIATGRRANTGSLFAPGLAIELERGAISVDSRFETSIPGVYAIGDCVSGGIQLAHMATAQGINAVCQMFGVLPPSDLSVVPSCVYTDPEIASVGISAEQAKAQGISVKTGKFIMSSNGKSLIEGAERGFIKVVFDGNTRELLGAQLMCSRATDLVTEFASALCNHLSVEQMAAVIRPHPTFSEAITEAVEDVEGKAVHIMPKRADLRA